MSIAGKIAALRKEAIDDTRSLLTHDDLQKVVLYMRKASSIGLYAVSNSLILTREFRHNMTRIGKRTELCQLQGERTDNGGDYQGIMTIDRKAGRQKRNGIYKNRRYKL